MNPLYRDMPVSIFTRMSALATEHQAINLGQGFPDADGPLDVRQAAADALLNDSNQYAPSPGMPALREAVAAHYARFQGLTLDWRTEVLITSGATEALAASISAIVAPGDEVVILEPAYDGYGPQIAAAAGVARPVRLTPPDWRITAEMLEAVTSPRTRAIVFNSPANPSARVYTAAELQVVADWCMRHDVVAICDEVWEHIVFDAPHVPMMSLPGMAERTVKIGSAGKIFSLTGWKVGFVCAAPPLMQAIQKAHQFLTFCTAPNLQTACAYGLGKDASYFEEMRARLKRSRDRLAAGLVAEGYAVLPSGGTYFLNIDLAASGMDVDDEAFCLRAVAEAGVAAIPLSPFYASDPVTSVVRLCFAKSDDTLDQGIERLARAKRMFER